MKGRAKMNAEKKKKYAKQLSKGYKKMTRNLQQGLEETGIRVEHDKKYIKIFYNVTLFIGFRSGNDYHSGMNLATAICREIA